MSAEDWRPRASLPALRARAALLAAARGFFARRGVLEVETPILSSAAVTDPHIDSLGTELDGGSYHLSTSPEYAMKRLLAAGCGDIYQICKAFREGERGRWHNPEFTLIEWYRLGFDDGALMGEVEALVREMFAPYRTLGPAERLSYAAALARYAGIDVRTAREAELEEAAARLGIECPSQLDRDGKLDLIMGVSVGPRLGLERPTFVFDYPASQAALARIKSTATAARFELYLDGLELANGFHELADASAQRERFERDLARRRMLGKREPQADERLLQALAAGLPDCAGVALGFDRLVATALRAGRLAEVMAFTIGEA